MTPSRFTGLALSALGLAGCGEDNAAPKCVEQSGVACVWAGTGTAGFNGDGLPLRESRLYSPLDVSFAPDGAPWVIDFNNHRLRRVESGRFSTKVGGLRPGDGDEAQADLTPAGAAGTDVLLNHPTDLAFEPDGRLLFAAWHNFKIRAWTPGDGLVHVLYGGKYYMGGYSGDGGPAASAAFNFPKSLVRLADGTLYVLDQRNQRIRRVASDEGRTVTTVAGDGKAGFAGDGGSALSAEFRFEGGNAPMPSGALALGPDGKLYVADSLNHRIRRIDLAADRIDTVAGTGIAGFGGDEGPALESQLSNPRDLEFGPDGRLYVADTDNHRVRAIDLATGVITTVAGTGVQGNGPEGRKATETDLHKPWGIDFDPAGALYIADTENHRIVKVPR
jgi:sugar lactone lactonase YvrE